MTVDLGQRAALAIETLGPMWHALTEIVAGRPAWMADAACRGADESFFPQRGEPTAGAKAVCARCEVRADCLAYALADPTLLGLWGGVGERERKKLRRQRRAEPIAV